MFVHTSGAFFVSNMKEYVMKETSCHGRLLCFVDIDRDVKISLCCSRIGPAVGLLKVLICRHVLVVTSDREAIYMPTKTDYLHKMKGLLCQVATKCDQ